MRTPRGHPAFSLLELIVVLAIVGMLASMAIVRFGNSAMRQRADAAARRVVSDLTLARRLADQASRGIAVNFNVGSDSYSLMGVDDPDHPGQGYAVHLAAEPYRATILSAAFNGAPLITFDAFGLPVEAGKETGTVLIQVGVEQRTITVDPETGEATRQ